jgi:hypothetical protein
MDEEDTRADNAAVGLGALLVSPAPAASCQHLVHTNGITNGVVSGCMTLSLTATVSVGVHVWQHRHCIQHGRSLRQHLLRTSNETACAPVASVGRLPVMG